MDSGSSGIVELGRFMTGFLVVMGVGKSYRRRLPVTRASELRLIQEALSMAKENSH